MRNKLMVCMLKRNTSREIIKKVRAVKSGPVIIFTDLDGTLLNHADYSFEAARPALLLIKQLGIPLILCTSKTRCEVEVLRRALEIDEPFIVENGGGIFFPAGYRGFRIPEAEERDGYQVIMLGAPHPLARIVVDHVRQTFPLRGFGDMEVEEVAEATGLPVEQAALAKKREFTEPLLLNEDVCKDELETSARAAGLRVIRGGRFWHLIGEHNDKGKAVDLTKAIFARHLSGTILTIGLGDSPNDLALLRNVDVPVLIPRPDGDFEAFDPPNLVKAPHPGSKGWNAVMMELLSELTRNGLFPQAKRRCDE